MTCWDFKGSLGQWLLKMFIIRAKYDGKHLVIQSLKKLRQLNLNFEASLSYAIQLSQKNLPYIITH